jgi:WXG100 family type VII secretion target
VTAADIQAASTATRQTAEEVQSDLNDLRRYVLDVEATWQGVASNTFQVLMHDFDVNSAMLNQALTDIASGLDGNYVNYAGTEEQLVKGLQAVNWRRGIQDLRPALAGATPPAEPGSSGGARRDRESRRAGRPRRQVSSRAARTAPISGSAPYRAAAVPGRRGRWPPA